MKIVCVNNIIINLTINKIYDVLIDGDYYYYIRNDSNVNFTYPIYYFISLDEYRDNVINKLL